MSEFAKVTPDLLADLAHKINVCAAKADDYRVTAAYHLAEAKRICAARGITFKVWVLDNVKFSYDEARKLAVAGESGNPAKAIADMRSRSRQSMAKSRAVQRGTARQPKPEPVPQALIDEVKAINAELERRDVDYVHAVVWDAKQSEAMGSLAEPSVGYFSEPCQAEAAKQAVNEAAAVVRQAKAAGRELPPPKPSTLQRFRRDLLYYCSEDGSGLAEAVCCLEELVKHAPNLIDDEVRHAVAEAARSWARLAELIEPV